MKFSNPSPKRLFTFGCSFTGYYWATWANILADELNPTEFYNYGRSGAGNPFIFNALMIADSEHNFTKDDLIVVQWTNVCRHDFYKDNKGWACNGNIFSQDHGDIQEEFVKKYFSVYGSYLRDLAIIKSTQAFLDKTNFHFIQMVDIMKFVDQWKDQPQVQLAWKVKEDCPEKTGVSEDDVKRLIELYGDTLDIIQPSFYEVLWNNDLDIILTKDSETINPLFFDGHPYPSEHLKYLTSVFDEHDWNDKTYQKLKYTDYVLFDWLIEKGREKTDNWYLGDLSIKELREVRDLSLIRKPDFFISGSPRYGQELGLMENIFENNRYKQDTVKLAVY